MRVAADLLFTTEIVINGTVTIYSSDHSVLSGSGANRLFNVVKGARLLLKGLRLTEGYSSCVGGAVHADVGGEDDGA